MSVSSYPDDENIHGDERVGYGGHGSNRGDISCYDCDRRLNRSRDNGDKRGVISADYGILLYRSKEIIHSSSINMEENSDGDWRGGCMSNTSHFSYHNQVDHVRLLPVSVDSRRVDDSLHYNVRGYSRGDDVIHGSRSQ